MGFEKALGTVKVIKDQILYMSQDLLNLAGGHISLKKLNIFGNLRHVVMHQSVPSANIPPPGNPRDFAPIFSPGQGNLYHLNCPGVAPIIRVPSCQLMPHEGTFQLQTDLPSIAAL